MEKMNLEKEEKDHQEEEEDDDEVNILFFSQEDNTDHQDELNSSPCLHQCSTTTPLQQHQYYPHHQEGIRMVDKNVNLAVLEILRDRREARESGRLKKKRLFEAFEDASDQMGNLEVKENDILRCACCTYSPKFSTTTSGDDDDECTVGGNCNFNYSSNTSTASSSLQEEILNEVEGGEEGKRVGDDHKGKWEAKNIPACIVVVFIAVALGIIINL